MAGSIQKWQEGIAVALTVQGITAAARAKPHQDARLDMEGRAKKLLERVG